MDCREGKILNPQTCVFVKECKPGFMRNENFQCRKDPYASPKVKASTKAKTKAKSNKANTRVFNVGNFNKSRKNSYNDLKRKLKSFGFIAKIPSNMSTNYDEDTVFVFYSKSTDASPGKGSNEKIPDEKREMYEDLARIPNWRKRLSNFWIQPFYKQGFLWASVEHYYQASKFKMQNEEFYKQFSLDKGTELSKDPVLAKEMGSTHKHRPRNIKIDDNFFPKRAQQEMFRAQHAKFTQNADLKYLLKATKKAKLMHYTQDGKLEPFDGLMYIRDHLLN